MPDLIPAAQYLRMSTEHQQFSMQNQAAAIQQYAELNGFEIVRTYADPARSGVVLRWRPGLQQLLKDVTAGARDFSAILVYDVSRWGRFQDTDEAAHYEYLCKSAQIPVHYCKEIFPNDGTLSSLIMKALKRVMAGEYSRELSVKVSAGQVRLAKLGFKQGGQPGYGLRRMLVSPDGAPKQKLDNGQRKNLTEDHVILVPGPEREAKTVREIYRMLIDRDFSISSIVRELNRRRTESQPGSKWGWRRVHDILTHPKYVGQHVYGKRSGKLYTPTVNLPQSEWIVTPKAFEPIIDYPTFAQAQQILYNRTLTKPDEALLEPLRRLMNRHGRLSGTLIDACEDALGQSTYRRHFGNLKHVYELIGYEHSSPIEFQSRSRALRQELIAELLKLLPDQIEVCRPKKQRRTQVRLRTGEWLSVLLVRAQPCKDGTPRWVLRPAPFEFQFPTLMARLDKENRTFMDFHLLPNLPKPTRSMLRENDPRLARGVLLSTLSDLPKALAQLTGRVGS